MRFREPASGPCRRPQLVANLLLRLWASLAPLPRAPARRAPAGPRARCRKAADARASVGALARALAPWAAHPSHHLRALAILALRAARAPSDPAAALDEKWLQGTEAALDMAERNSEAPPRLAPPRPASPRLAPRTTRRGAERAGSRAVGRARGRRTGGGAARAAGVAVLRAAWSHFGAWSHFESLLPRGRLREGAAPAPTGSAPPPPD